MFIYYNANPVLDKLCQQEIDALKTQALEQYLNPVPIPAYMVQNPNCCSANWYSNCGCNSVA